MSIILHLDRVMADRKMSLNDLAEQVGITNVNLSRIKTGKVRAIRFSTLDAICKVLRCQPGDVLRYVDDDGEDYLDDNKLIGGTVEDAAELLRFSPNARRPPSH